MSEAIITVGTIAIARTATGNVEVSNPHDRIAYARNGHPCLHVQKADVPDLVRAVDALALTIPVAELMAFTVEGPDAPPGGPLHASEVDTLLQYGQALAHPARSGMERYAGGLVCRAAVELREYRRELEPPATESDGGRPPEDSTALKRAIAFGESYDLKALAKSAAYGGRVERESISCENLHALLRAQEIMLGDLAAVYAAMRNPRRVGCAWCAEAGTPRDEMTKDEAREHAQQCEHSPLVQRVRQLEAHAACTTEGCCFGDCPSCKLTVAAEPRVREILEGDPMSDDPDWKKLQPRSMPDPTWPECAARGDACYCGELAIVDRPCTK